MVASDPLIKHIPSTYQFEFIKYTTKHTNGRCSPTSLRRQSISPEVSARSVYCGKKGHIKEQCRSRSKPVRTVVAVGHVTHGLKIRDQNELNARAIKVGACPVCNYKPYYQPKAGPIMGYDVPSDILFCCPTFSKKCLDNWVLDVEKNKGCII